MTHEYVLDEERQDLEPVKQKDLLIKVVDSDDDVRLDRKECFAEIQGAESQTVPALGNFPKPKQKSCTTTCCALEQLILAMKAKNNFELDAYDATCMNMASTLRTLAALDENLGRQWKLKMDELQLEAAREIVRLQESS
ncbi:hypothetical protein Q1695_007214 [Nippostrongylus brasiliensis]|nr:hypothetical protein Q1695_007214 [Nippostrongylus brasiliensis]